MRALRIALLAALATVLALAGGALALALSGFYEVSALRSHGGAVEWFLVTARERSVAARSAGIAVPPLDDPALARRAAPLYQQLCAGCHGAPGVPMSQVGQGLNPVPPELVYSDFGGERRAAEIYWVLDNGIRMTGMPAFGLALDEDELWALVALVQRLPAMSAEEYAAAAESGAAAGSDPAVAAAPPPSPRSR
jgi:mono/diheme cytochrome c family protein